ncbi:hypothetical protein SEN110799_01370 [Salmonella enterica subsp. enterica serovar Kentucky]|nr:hypothetical protein SEEK9263_18064 [Salmonella enterica subsp. enterica serovar Kentucky str. ATCC 9263]CAH2846103.1 hypothetical protein SEN110799_01370 [Salmonella enterica subsp. enterica serovar Kentucky]CAH2865448.1 hypothetical protein SEN1985_36380 [Salmonella enterica subsp. enterica serovar Kentucky]
MNICKVLSFIVCVIDSLLLMSENSSVTPQVIANIILANMLENTAIYEAKNIDEEYQTPFLFKMLTSKFL